MNMGIVLDADEDIIDINCKCPNCDYVSWYKTPSWEYYDGKEVQILCKKCNVKYKVKES